MDKWSIKIKNKFPSNDPPHSINSPILISYDYDLGWIIEEVVDGGEYEIQNLPYPGTKNYYFSLEEIPKEKDIWIYGPDLYNHPI